MNTVYILLGANLGDPINQIEQAIQLLKNKIGNLIATSSLYKSEAWGIENQPVFYNQVLVIETTLDPSDCLVVCQEVEILLGRKRDIKWGARVIDIDILYINNLIIDTATLSIPHPYIHKRNFTLIPLCELAPNFIHPKLKKSNLQLLSESEDHLRVEEFKNVV